MINISYTFMRSTVNNKLLCRTFIVKRALIVTLLFVSIVNRSYAWIWWQTPSAEGKLNENTKMIMKDTERELQDEYIYIYF